MPPEETTVSEMSQSTPEPQAPAAEASAPPASPQATQDTAPELSQPPLETAPPELAAPEPAPAPEPQTAPSSVKTADGAQEPTRTAQIPPSEPIAPAAVAHPARELLAKARATIQFRKTKKLDKIMAVINQKGKLTNDEVEKLLHISDATASRYLSTLVKQGKVRQVGKTGTAVMYTKI